MYGAEYVSNSNGALAAYYASFGGGGGGGGGLSGANNGLSVSGANVQLGKTTVGTGTHNFTTDRALFMAGFKYIYGGTAGDNGFCYDGATGIVIIGSATPNGSAILELISTTKGFLKPRQTTTQRDLIASPQSGLEIFNVTTTRPNFYDGSAWIEVAVAGAALTAANNGLSVSGTTVQLGHAAAGSGSSNFSANRFMYLSGFNLEIGGSVGASSIFKLEGATGMISMRSISGAVGIFFGDATKAFMAIDAGGLGTTQTNYTGFSLINSVDAAVGAQQISPNIMWEGSGWKTNASAGAQKVRFRADVLPVQGAVNPSGYWRLSVSINGGAYTDPLTVDEKGNIQTIGSYSIGVDTAVSTQVIASILVVSSSADVGLSLNPKGTGALMAHRPSGSAAGGNARGQYAVDLQLSRAAAAQVVSGNYSGVLSGRNNTVSASDSVAIGGQGNILTGFASVSLGGEANSASGSYSVVMGYRGIAYLYGMVTRGNGPFAVSGDCQASTLFVLKSDNTLTTGKTTALSIDGGGGALTPSGNNRAWNVQINWIGVVTVVTGTATGVSVGDVISQTDFLAIKRVGGTSALIDTPDSITKGNTAIMKTALMTYSIGGSANLVPTFSAPIFAGGGTLTMRILGNVQLTEVAW